MHERSLVNSLLRQVSELQAGQTEGRIVTIRVSMGEFSGVDIELFIGAFEEMVIDSPVSGATLEVQAVPLTARCRACGEEFQVMRFFFSCPVCSHHLVTVVRGEGIQLENVVVETQV